jgi:hypothetical protein
MEPFNLPRQPRRPYGSGIATSDDLVAMENRIMTSLENAVTAMQQAVADATARFGQTDVGALQAALDAERARYTTLAASDQAHDVEQDAELASAKAETDRLVQQMNDAAGALTQLTDQLNQVAPAAPADTGTTPAPAATPAPAPAPAPADAGPTPAADTTATPDTGGNAPAAPNDGPTPTDTGAAPDQVADTPSAASVVDNTPEGGDPTDVTNMRPNL